MRGRYCLGPSRPRSLHSLPGVVMRLDEDLRKCVVFLGTPDSEENGGIKCFGTAFLLGYEQRRYLVTNQHIAAGIGDSPFLLRINRTDGPAENFTWDPLTDGLVWYSHPTDPDVDLAVTPLEWDFRVVGCDYLYLSQDYLIDDAYISANDIGIGDACYTIGLFRLLAGKKRNLPVVHTGNIALVPSDEKIPVRDWLDGDARKRRHVVGYLVETQALKGLSGSPVFVRSTLSLNNISMQDGSTRQALLARRDLRLLGVWQSSWDAPPDEVQAIERGEDRVRVPVGMGVVVPTSKLIEILDRQDLKAMRAKLHEQAELVGAATPDMIPVKT